MIFTPLHEDRKYAEKQYRALHSLVCSQESQISNLRKKVGELENSLKLVDKAEIDALYSENERLTNLLDKEAE